MAIYLGDIDVNPLIPQPFYLGTASVASLWMGSVQVWPEPPALYNIWILNGSTSTPNQTTLESKLSGETLNRFVITSTTVSANTTTNFTVPFYAFASTSGSTNRITGFSSSFVTDIGANSFANNSALGVGAANMVVGGGGNTLTRFFAPNLLTAGTNSFSGQNLNYISQTNYNAQVYIPQITTIAPGMFSNQTGSFLLNIPFSASLPNVTRVGSYSFAHIPQNILVNRPYYSGSGLVKISQTEDFGGVYIPSNLTVAGDFTFSNSQNLISASFPNTDWSLANNMFFSCSKLNKISDTDPTWPIYLPTFPTGTVAYSATSGNPSQAFQGCGILNSASMSNLVVVKSGMFMSTAVEYISKTDPTAGFYFPSLLKTDTTAFDNCIRLKTVVLPNMTLIWNSTFQNCRTLTSVDLTGLNNAIQALGNSAANNSVFLNTGLNGNITIPTYFATNNAGNPDGDVQYLIGRGWTPNYV